MNFEIIHSGEKEKWQLLFMRQTNRKRKYSFLNYDQYNRREALKTLFQPSFFLNGNDEEGYVEEMLKNSMVPKFTIANHSAYRTPIDPSLKIFVGNRGGTLTNTTIGGINDPKLQDLTENPNTFPFLFKGKYNSNERNLKTSSILDIGRHHCLERDFRKKVEKEKKKLRQKRSDEFDENVTIYIRTKKVI